MLKLASYSLNDGHTTSLLFTIEHMDGCRSWACRLSLIYCYWLNGQSAPGTYFTNLFLLVLHTNNGHPLVSEELNRADHGQWTRFTCTPVILSSTLRVCGSFLATYKNLQDLSTWRSIMSQGWQHPVSFAWLRLLPCAWGFVWDSESLVKTLIARIFDRLLLHHSLTLTGLHPLHLMTSIFYYELCSVAYFGGNSRWSFRPHAFFRIPLTRRQNIAYILVVSENCAKWIPITGLSRCDYWEAQHPCSIAGDVM